MEQKQRLQRTQQIVQDASGIIEKLHMMAADDGMIQNDEVDLINVISRNIKEYQELLDLVLEDGEVDDKELGKMKTLEASIIENVEKQAKSDGKVTVPEKELMSTLFDCLNHFKDLNSID